MNWNPKTGEQEMDLSIAKYSSVQHEQSSDGLLYELTTTGNGIENLDGASNLD